MEYSHLKQHLIIYKSTEENADFIFSFYYLVLKYETTNASSTLSSLWAYKNTFSSKKHILHGQRF